MKFSRQGNSTVVFPVMPVVRSSACVVGPKEGKGPLREGFDLIHEDTLAGRTSWEKAESLMLRQSLDIALAKAGLDETQIDFLLAGDLLNQIISANFMAREFDVPFIGLYGACSTMAEGLTIASMLVAGGFARNAALAVSSHHDTAERQYRYPTEFAYMRTPTSQWTVTAACSAVIGVMGNGPWIEAVTAGRVQDNGVTDANDMGSAMAPAFADTVWRHLQDMSRKPEDYDLILSGDLGKIGSRLARELLRKKGVDIEDRHRDAGLLIYEDRPEIGAGGSGCACSAAVFSAMVVPSMRRGELKRVLFVATGALHSPTTCQQGESIPSIAHAVSLVWKSEEVKS